MLILEFKAQLNSDGTLKIPEEIAAQIRPGGQQVRVVMMVEESEEEEDRDWHQLALERFFKDDAEGDSIYDELPRG
jgi:hypothetical protein